MSRIPRMPHDDEPIPPELNLRCSSCGYALTGLLVRRCPECGEAFDPRETWLENEASTWEFHFENVRPRQVYLFYVAVAALGLTFIAMTRVSPLVWFGVLVVPVGEFYLHLSPHRPIRVRLTYLSIAVLWAVIVWVARL